MKYIAKFKIEGKNLINLDLFILLDNQLVWAEPYVVKPGDGLSAGDKFTRVEFLNSDMNMYSMFVYYYTWNHAIELDLWATPFIVAADPDEIVKWRLNERVE
jgi:hypothetical protein